MKERNDPYTEKSMPTFLKIKSSECNEPFIITLDQKDNYYEVNSVCQTVLQVSPNHNILLKSPERSISIELSFARNIPSGEDHLFLSEHSFNIEEQYQKLKNKGLPIPEDLTPTSFLSYVFNKNILSTTLFQRTIEYFLTQAILEVIQLENSVFHKSILSYLNPNYSSNLNFPNIVSNTLINVISNIFEECIYSESKLFYLVPTSLQFLELLTTLIIQEKISYKSVRKSISIFRPSVFSEYLIIYLIASIHSVVKSNEIFYLLHKLFQTKWLFHVFRYPEEIPGLLISTDISNFVPYLIIYGFIYQYLKGIKDIHTTIIYIENIGLKSIFLSKRILKSLIDPFIEYLYDKILTQQFEDITNLELDKKRFEEIKYYYEGYLPIFQKFIRDNNDNIQIHTLKRFHKYFRRHNYEPKGITIFTYSFLFNKGIIKSKSFNQWIERLNRNKTVTGIILEISTILNPFIKENIPVEEYLDKTIEEQIKYDRKEMKEFLEQSNKKIQNFNFDIE